MGRISALAPPCDWDFDLDTDDISNAGPLARTFLAWLTANENFCIEQIADLAEAKFVWGEILVGANDKARRKKPLSSEPESVQLSDEKDDSVYVFMKEVWGRVAEMDLDSSAPKTDSQFLSDFDAVYTWALFIFQDWHDRILFVTDCGKFGYASTDVAVGEAVGVLYGGPSMYVLRKREGERDAKVLEYQFVSESYVFDCMDGQIFDRMDEGSVKEELFAIS